MIETTTRSLDQHSIRSETVHRAGVDLLGFENHVWSQIAIRDKRGSWMQWLQKPPAGAIAIIAIAVGIYLGFSQAADYGKQASLHMEQHYVESIHPVMMSASHTDTASRAPDVATEEEHHFIRRHATP